MTHGRLLLLGFVLVTYPSCDPGIEVPARLAPLASAAIEPGVGLGALRLGQTTLAEVVAGYGPGHVSLLAGDHYGFELRFVSGQLELSFPMTEELSRTLDFGELKGAVRDLDTYVLAHRDVGATPLASIGIDAGRAATSTFHHGKLSGSVGLRDSLFDWIEVLGTPLHEDPPEIEGTGESAIMTRRCSFPGIAIVARGRLDEEGGPRVVRIDLFATRD